MPFLLADLGDLHALLEDFETAAVLHGQALDAVAELGAQDAMALARTGLARAARRQGRPDQAREPLGAAAGRVAAAWDCLGTGEGLPGDIPFALPGVIGAV